MRNSKSIVFPQGFSTQELEDELRRRKTEARGKPKKPKKPSLPAHPKVEFIVSGELTRLYEGDAITIPTIRSMLGASTGVSIGIDDICITWEEGSPYDDDHGRVIIGYEKHVPNEHYAGDMAEYESRVAQKQAEYDEKLGEYQVVLGQWLKEHPDDNEK